MTRKDCVAIAAALSKLTLYVTDERGASVIKTHHARVCNALADHMANDNPRFDRDRFLKACGVKS